ncbi:MAG: hypothetical protein U0359_29235 [Byssovorax sp.]
MVRLRSLLPLLGALSLAACTSLLGDFTLSNGTTGTGGAGGTTTSTSATATSGGGGVGGVPASTSGTGGGVTTSGTGGVDGTGGAGGSMTCVTDGDCKPLATPCVLAHCDMSLCKLEYVAAGEGVLSQIPGDCKTITCDGAGKTQQTSSDVDIEDDHNPCTNDSCGNGVAMHSPLPPSAPCTDPANPKLKVCSDKHECVQCMNNSDCAAATCSNNLCVAASCSDGVQNGAESDVDCGGGCVPCAAGKSCNNQSDCDSFDCDIGAHQCIAASCSDGIKNQNETDADCGGTICPACSAGKVCNVAADCASNVCSNGTCEVFTCNDGLMDGTESDVDCGGGACAGCESGKICLVNMDCLSNHCKPGFVCE